MTTRARKVGRFFDRASILLVVWTGLALVPLDWLWFKPRVLQVADTTVTEPAAIRFERTIRRDFIGEYSVTVRGIDRGIVCQASSTRFPYERGATLPEPLDMAWWAPGDSRCARLYPPGTYSMETCWTGYVWFRLVPAKTTCMESNPFTVVGPDQKPGGKK